MPQASDELRQKMKDRFGDDWLEEGPVFFLRAAAEIERLRAALEKADALADSQYRAGAQAGFNAAQADDPNAAIARLIESRAGCLAALNHKGGEE